MPKNRERALLYFIDDNHHRGPLKVIPIMATITDRQITLDEACPGSFLHRLTPGRMVARGAEEALEQYRTKAISALTDSLNAVARYKQLVASAGEMLVSLEDSEHPNNGQETTP